MCGLATVLDPESATTLISMYHELEEENISPVPRNHHYNIVNSPQSRYSTNEMPRQVEASRETLGNAKRTTNSEQIYCTEHPDEFINYFCFQCNSGNICAE